MEQPDIPAPGLSQTAKPLCHDWTHYQHCVKSLSCLTCTVGKNDVALAAYRVWFFVHILCSLCWCFSASHRAYGHVTISLDSSTSSTVFYIFFVHYRCTAAQWRIRWLLTDLYDKKSSCWWASNALWPNIDWRWISLYIYLPPDRVEIPWAQPGVGKRMRLMTMTLHNEWTIYLTATQRRVGLTGKQSTSSSHRTRRPHWTEARRPEWWLEPRSADRYIAVARSPGQSPRSASELVKPPAGRPGPHASAPSTQPPPRCGWAPVSWWRWSVALLRWNCCLTQAALNTAIIKHTATTSTSMFSLFNHLPSFTLLSLLYSCCK